MNWCSYVPFAQKTSIFCTASVGSESPKVYCWCMINKGSRTPTHTGNTESLWYFGIYLITSGPEQNGSHFVCNIFESTFLNENFNILIQISLLGAKPLSEPMLAHCHLDHWEQILLKLESKYNSFQSRKWIFKCHLQNGDHFVSTSMCEQHSKGWRY